MDLMDAVKVRFFAAARTAVGSNQLEVEPGTLKEILASVAYGNDKANQVFDQCSFLVDGVVVHDQSILIMAGSILDVLPPFAGGS